MPQALDRFFDTPELHFLAFKEDEALFIHMNRESYLSSIFLDHRASSLDTEPISTALQPLIEAARERAILRTGWIFHIAHCGSTLLSRMIDLPKSGLVLREPPPLRQLGVLAASAGRSDDWVDRLKLAYTMVSRRFEPSQPTVVKANVPVNFIIPEILQLDPGAPSVLLYSALEPYLLAILREPRRRAWVNRVTHVLQPGLAAQVGLGTRSETAERAAALWLVQMLIFDSVLHSNPSARSLDAEAFFSSPVEAAETVAAHLGVSFTHTIGDLDELVSTHSKDPSRPFNEAVRRQRRRDDRVLLRDDLRKARRWMEEAAAARDLPQSLHQPLFGPVSPLLA